MYSGGASGRIRTDEVILMMEEVALGRKMGYEDNSIQDFSRCQYIKDSKKTQTSDHQYNCSQNNYDTPFHRSDLPKPSSHSAEGDPDIHVLLIPPSSDMEINALQRAATVVVQKSLRESFGLTVSEALWKVKPVVASAVGGIPLQVRDRFTGLLSHGIKGAAYDLRQLLTNPEYARWLGQNGREHVRQNFLITRHLRDYLLLFLSIDHREDIIYL